MTTVRAPATGRIDPTTGAVDAYGATVMGWQPADLPSLVEANARGLGEIDLSKYDIFEGTA